MRAVRAGSAWGPGVPGDEEPPPSEVLAALVASLRRELAGAVAALGQARSELAQARERIAELETRLRQNPRNSSRAAVGRGTGQAAAEAAVAAEETVSPPDTVEKLLAEKSTILSTRSLRIIHSILSRSVKKAQARDKVRRNIMLLAEVPDGRTSRPRKRSRSPRPKPC
jgi:hypothetical protein